MEHTDEMAWVAGMQLPVESRGKKLLHSDPTSKEKPFARKIEMVGGPEAF